jgi:succinate dehydrogenase hydrophobic anchor subunit
VRKVLSRIWDLIADASEGEGRGAVIQLALFGVVILALCVLGTYVLVTTS